jgi:hypothetical protein
MELWGTLKVETKPWELQEFLDNFLPNQITFALPLARFAFMRHYLNNRSSLNSRLSICRNNIPPPVLDRIFKLGFSLPWIDENNNIWWTIPLILHVIGRKIHNKRRTSTATGYCSIIAIPKNGLHPLPLAISASLTLEKPDTSPTTGLEMYLPLGYQKAHVRMLGLLKEFTERVKKTVHFNEDIEKTERGGYKSSYANGIWKITGPTEESYLIPDYGNKRAPLERELRELVALGTHVPNL